MKASSIVSSLFIGGWLVVWGANSAAETSATPGDRCAGMIQNNTAAAGVCEPICEKAGLVFGGNWSNDPHHPPVKECVAKKQGSSVCGCAAKK